MDGDYDEGYVCWDGLSKILLFRVTFLSSQLTQIVAADDRNEKAKSELNAVRGVLTQIQGLVNGLGTNAGVFAPLLDDPPDPKVAAPTRDPIGSKAALEPQSKENVGVGLPRQSVRHPSTALKYRLPHASPPSASSAAAASVPIAAVTTGKMA